MPAGRPKIKRTQEDAIAAQRLSKRLYARRIRSQQVSVKPAENSLPSPPEWDVPRATTPSLSLSQTSLLPPFPDTVASQPLERLSGVEQSVIPWLGDLELLHHFTTQTYYDFFDIASSRKIWQTIVPQMAFSCPFLMRGLLATSALHLAYLRPQEARDFEVKALAHQNAALGPFREAMRINSPSNCHALFAYSMILVVLGFASPYPSSNGTILDVREKTTRWIRLVRGVRPMLGPMWGHLFKGSLRDLFTTGLRKSDSATGQMPADIGVHYDALVRLCDEFEDPEIREPCVETLEELRGCFICTEMALKNPAMSDLATVMSWLNRIPPRFLAELEKGHPLAMIILAYYTIALRHLDHLWWVNGEPSRILLSVYGLLDKPMRHWLDYPLRILKLEQEAKNMV